MQVVIEIAVKDISGTEFIFLARNESEEALLVDDIYAHGAVQVNNVLIMKDGEVTGYVEDALITLTMLDPLTVMSRECKDPEPKFALL